MEPAENFSGDPDSWPPKKLKRFIEKYQPGGTTGIVEKVELIQKAKNIKRKRNAEIAVGAAASPAPSKSAGLAGGVGAAASPAPSRTSPVQALILSEIHEHTQCQLLNMQFLHQFITENGFKPSEIVFVSESNSPNPCFTPFLRFDGILNIFERESADDGEIGSISGFSRAAQACIAILNGTKSQTEILVGTTTRGDYLKRWFSNTLEFRPVFDKLGVTKNADNFLKASLEGNREVAFSELRTLTNAIVEYLRSMPEPDATLIAEFTRFPDNVDTAADAIAVRAKGIRDEIMVGKARRVLEGDSKRRLVVFSVGALHHDNIDRLLRTIPYMVVHPMGKTIADQILGRKSTPKEKGGAASGGAKGGGRKTRSGKSKKSKKSRHRRSTS